MNVGLIGYGFMGGAHLAAILAQPETTLKAIASRSRPNVKVPKSGNLNLPSVPLPPGVHWDPDWNTIVHDPTIHAADICLPTHLHKQVALEAFAHGKHVLCEKPMALTPNDCDELLAAAAQASRIFMVAQVLRFMDPYRHAATFLRSHANIKHCTLRRTTGFPQWSEWLADPSRSGGAILDLLSHDLDQALSWFGPPLAVSATSMGQIDTARATLTYPDDRQVIVEGGWLSAEVPFSQSFDLQAPDAALTFAEGKLQLTHTGLVEDIALPPQDPYAEEIAYFLACCRTGEAPTLCPPAESANAVRLATLVHRSREQNGKELPWT